MEEKMIIAIDKDDLLLVFESQEQAVSVVGSDAGWNIEEVDFYTGEGQRLVLKEDGTGAYRLVSHDRPDKRNIEVLFARAKDVVSSKVSSINSLSDLKKALSLENII